MNRLERWTNRSVFLVAVSVGLALVGGGCDGGDGGADSMVGGPDAFGPADAFVKSPDLVLDPTADPQIIGYSVETLSDGVFPTYLAHLYNSNIGGDRLNLVDELQLFNPSPTMRKVLARVTLNGYSDPREELVTLGPGETKTLGLSPQLRLPALYALKAPASTTLEIELRDPASTNAVWDKIVEDLSIASVNTVFWAVPGDGGAWDDVGPLSAVLVTPHDQDDAISKLLTDAASFSAFGSMIGYQYDGTSKLTARSATIAPGDCRSSYDYYREGTAVSVDVDVTCFPCVNYNAEYGLYNETTESFIAANSDLGEWKSTITIPQDGSYRHVMCNPAGNSGDRTFKLAYTMGLQGGAVDQISAIFDALKARDMKYTNVPQDFFAASQYVKLPAESLATGSQNCIDGSLVFASALEAMGMRALLEFVPGHAFVAVRIFDDPAAPILAIETTMVSTATATDAINQGLQRHSEEQTLGTLRIVDITKMRELGILPIPK